MTRPAFRYHPDPVATGSVVASENACRVCGRSRGFVYAIAPYCEEDGLEDSICPWCIADGAAHAKFDAMFVDSAVFDGQVPGAVVEEISERTPGYASWQTEAWPACCGDATAFLGPTGIEEIRAGQYELEGMLMGHVVHNMQISGGAATRLVRSLNRDRGPTAYVFQCLHCSAHRFHIDWV